MIEVLKQALEALDKLSTVADGFSVSGVYFNDGLWEKKCLNGAYVAIESLRQAIAELESQEPVACERCKQLEEQAYDLLGQLKVANIKLAYKHPPQRTWVGSGDLEDSNAYLTSSTWVELTNEEKNT